MSESLLPPLVAEVLASNTGFLAKMAETKAAAEEATGKMSAGFASLKSIGKTALLGVAGIAGTVGLAALKMGGDFQASMTQLVTGAGESHANLKMVQEGILKMSAQVDTSAKDLASGMYLIESAGYHGADGLTILRTAAEGAKVGNADLATVSDALTSALNAYHLPASAAVGVTNDLIATVANGKMHMQDLASSLGTILPIASALNVPLDQVTAAMSTMTMQGTDASTATTSLRFLMAALAGPTAAAAKEMQGLGVGMDQIPGITAATSKAISDLGLHTSDVAATLSSKGLPAALAMVTDAIGKKFPVGSAAYEAALKGVVGGTRGMTAALELTGPSMATFNSNLTAIHGAATKGGGAVAGWSDIQKDFNTKLSEGQIAIGSLATELGLKLIPYVEDVISDISQVVRWFEKHKVAAVALAAGIGGPLVAAIISYGVAMLPAVAETIIMMAPLIALAALCAALGAAAYELATHWGEVWHDIQQWTEDAWQYIQNISEDVLHFFNNMWGDIQQWASDAWQYIYKTAVAPINMLIGAFDAVFGFIAGGATNIINSFLDVWNFMVQLPGDILHLGEAIGKGLANGFIWGINAIIEAWDWLVSFLKIPGFSVGPIHFGGLDIGSALKISEIGYLAAGTDNWRGGAAVVGENGPELLNLPRGSQVIPNNRMGDGGGTNVQVVIQGSYYGQGGVNQLAEQIRTVLLRSSKSRTATGLA
ncbi:MAG: phage tail tape measure protein [Solirubrobacteraceae bacterium]